MWRWGLALATGLVIAVSTSVMATDPAQLESSGEGFVLLSAWSAASALCAIRSALGLLRRDRPGHAWLAYLLLPFAAPLLLIPLIGPLRWLTYDVIAKRVAPRPDGLHLVALALFEGALITLVALLARLLVARLAARWRARSGARGSTPK